MVDHRISISKKNMRLLQNREDLDYVKEQMNQLIPKIVEEKKQSKVDIPSQILVRTTTLPESVKRMIEEEKQKKDCSYAEVIRDLLQELCYLRLDGMEKRILNKIEQATEIQCEYYRETIYQINEFLKSLEE